eukprot:1575415-Pleurochrysis_carterae.AAC.1
MSRWNLACSRGSSRWRRLHPPPTSHRIGCAFHVRPRKRLECRLTDAPLRARDFLDETVERRHENDKPLCRAVFANKCAIMSDGWDDIERNYLVNVLVDSSKGVFFHATKMLTSADHEDAESVAIIIIEGMRSTGALSVVQVCADTCAVLKAAWRIVEKRYPWVTPTCCGLHVLNMELKDIAK